MSETSITDGETQFHGDVIIKLHGEWVPYCAYQNIEHELNSANERIKRLEEAVDHMALYATIGVIAWNSAKKAKP